MTFASDFRNVVVGLIKSPNVPGDEVNAPFVSVTTSGAIMREMKL